MYNKEKDIAGVIDLVVLYSNGSVGVYDYKGIKDYSQQQYATVYNEDDYDTEISGYKTILAEAYGVKNFGETRIIPIDMKLVSGKDNWKAFGDIAMISLEMILKLIQAIMNSGPE